MCILYVKFVSDVKSLSSSFPSRKTRVVLLGKRNGVYRRVDFHVKDDG